MFPVKPLDKTSPIQPVDPRRPVDHLAERKSSPRSKSRPEPQEPDRDDGQPPHLDEFA
ncbi:hypothetical protein [Methylothermus subterraneus]